MTDKIDLKQAHPGYRARRGRYDIVDLPEARYLMIDGHGDPNTSAEFADAVAALYPVAYRLKFASKRELGRDYVVPPLEGLWWADDPGLFTVRRDASQWNWTLLSLVPEWVGGDLVRAAFDQVRSVTSPARLDEVRVDTLAEGRCVQTLHVGSFDDEAPVLAEMHDRVIPEAGLRPVGRHHEIYLSDFRRTEPARQRTILRQPVAAR